MASVSLSDQDRAVIRAVEFRARVPLAKIGHELGMREHKVRRILGRLIDEQILKPGIFVNLFPIGLRGFSVFCRFTTRNQEDEGRFIEMCLQSERVSYFCELGGEYNYCIGLYAHDVLDVHNFLASLSNDCGVMFLKKDVATMVSLTDFGVKTIYATKPTDNVVRIGPTGKSVALQETDHRLLCTLIDHPHAPVTELARRLNTPVTTVDYRLKSLERSCIVPGYRYVFFGDKRNILYFRLLISTKGAHRKFLDKFSRFVLLNHSVAFAIETLGAWDFELGIRVENQGQLRDFIRDLHRQFGEYINSISSLSVFNLLKLANYPFRRWPILGGW